jgi:hypothetical protein
MDRLIIPGRGGPRLVKNADGTISVSGEHIRQEPMGLLSIDRIGEPGKLTKVSAQDTILAAARMQRDGYSLKQIREYLGDPMEKMPVIDRRTGALVRPGVPVSDDMLQKALDAGHELLAKLIAEGAEPEESRILAEVPLAIWEEGDLPMGDND